MLNGTRSRLRLALLAVFVILAVVLLLLLYSGVIGSTERGTAEQRLQTVASQLHAPGDTTTQTVASSNVAAAWAIRRQIVTMLDKGMSNAQILSTLEADYGPTVLANPPGRGFGAVAWGLPVAGVVAAVLIGAISARRYSVKLSPDKGIVKVEESAASLLKEEEWRRYL